MEREGSIYELIDSSSLIIQTFNQFNPTFPLIYLLSSFQILYSSCPAPSAFSTPYNIQTNLSIYLSIYFQTNTHSPTIKMLRNILYLFALLALFTTILATPAPSDLEVRTVPSVLDLLEARAKHSKANSTDTTTTATKAASNGSIKAASNSTSSGKKSKSTKAADLSSAATNSTSSTKGHKAKNGTATASGAGKSSKKNSTATGAADGKAGKAKSTGTGTSSSSVATSTTSLGVRVEALSTIMLGLLVAAGFSLL